MTKIETTNTTIKAEKIEGSAIGKGNKVSSFKLDGLQVVLIILAAGVLLLLLVAAIVFIASKGQINLFPPLQPLFNHLITPS